MKNSYEAEVGETAKAGLTVIKSIKVSDPDLVGETLEIKCLDVLEVIQANNFRYWCSIKIIFILVWKLVSFI